MVREADPQYKVGQTDMKEIRGGQRYRTFTDLPVLALTQWYSSFTGGQEGILPAGESFTVDHDPMPGAPGVACKPDRYEEMELHLVQESERRAEKYAGYYLVIPLDLIRQCELLD